MTEKRRFLDVWIVESNIVYKEVPFEVVVDWVQQGRLLEDDMLKPSGTRDWFRVGGSPEFSPYLLRPEPGRVEDQAEALEPIGEDFPIKRSRIEEEDDDVDMIPLIDVSLVLLVFFMIIGTGSAVAGYVQTPEAEHAQQAEKDRAIRIDITRGDDGRPRYAVAIGDEPPATREDGTLHTVATRRELLDWIKARLATVSRIEVVINADKTLDSSIPRGVLVSLREEAGRDAAFRTKISGTYFGVTGKREE